VKIWAVVDAEDMGKTCADLFFGPVLSLGRLEECKFLHGAVKALLRACLNDGHRFGRRSSYCSVIHQGILQSRSRRLKNPEDLQWDGDRIREAVGENFAQRKDCSHTNCQGLRCCCSSCRMRNSNLRSQITTGTR
jgi:hypothetical protein